MIKVLIVDDISENLYLLESLLVGNGFKTISAINGAEALGLALKDTPDIVISDILMPVMDGYSLCREWKKDKRLKHIPFVFYTATYTHPKDEEFALNLGADLFMIKPQEPEAFIAKIQKVLNEFDGMKLKIRKPSKSSELDVYKEYNETLIRKMENRMLQSEEAEKKIRNYATQLENEIEQKNLATQALKESEEKYRSIFENSGIAILLTSPDGSIFSANNEACKIFNRTEEELIEVGRSGLVDISNPNLQILLHEREKDGRASGELTMIRKNGSFFPAGISSVVFLDKDGNERTSMVIHDLTEQKKAEAELKNSEWKYRIVADNTYDWEFWVDQEDRFLYCSPSCSRLTGHEASEFMGDPTLLHHIIHPDDRDEFTRHRKTILNSLLPSEIQFRILLHDGTEMWIDHVCQAVLDENGVSLGRRGSNRDITAQKQIEVALKESEERFRSIFENATIGIYRTTRDGRIILANPALIRMLKYDSIEDMLTLNIEENGFDQEYQRTKFRHLIESDGEIKGLEWAWKCKDKTAIYVRESAKVFRDNSGKVLYYEGMVEDITDQKQVEEELKESERRLSFAMEAANDGLWDVNMKTNDVFISSRGCEILGYKPEESNEIAKVWSDFVHPDDLAITFERLNSHIDGHSVIFHVEQRLRMKSGQWKWVLSRGKIVERDNEGKPSRMVGTHTDITERKKVEDALIESQQLFQNLAQVSPVGIFRTDMDGNTTYVNPRWSELTGLSFDEAKGKSWVNAVHPDDRQSIIDEWNNNVILQQSLLREYRFLKPDGAIVWVIGNAVPEYKNNIVDGFIGTITDITERKQVEDLLLIAKEKAEESDRLKTAFLHNISHEIRTPMNAIIGFSDFLNGPDLTAEKRNYFTEIITQSCNQLLLIITDIINIATIEAGQVKLQLINANLNSILKFLYNQFNLKAKEQNLLFNLKTRLSDEDVEILTDGTKVSEIISNLLSNAFKFTRQGFVNFGYEIKDGFIEFYVEDSGIGIPTDMHGEIFNRFRQVEITANREYGGSGLGLSISKAYVELLGGKIWLSSKPNQGSVFYFTIPYKRVGTKTAIQILPVKKLTIEANKHLSILVAEDNDFNFMLLEESLTDLNYTLIRAINGVEAVEICRTNQSIDLVLMDIKMPLMSGFEATLLVKELRPDLPIIALTAYSTEQDKEKVLNSGCSDFIGKPYKKDQLLIKINEILKSH